MCFYRSQSSKTPDKSAEKKNKQKNTSEKATVENSRASQEQTYPNGLVVEELKLGKPNGKQATPGKQVYWYSVHIWLLHKCHVDFRQGGSVIKCGFLKESKPMSNKT